MKRARPVIPSAARDLLLGLAAAAVFYQGLIPAGYMAATRSELAQGEWVVPCPAQNELVAAAARAMEGHAHHHHGGAPHKHSATGGHSCVFAAAASVALPGGAGTALPLPVAAAAPIQNLAADFRGAHLHLLPPARGPPVYS